MTTIIVYTSQATAEGGGDIEAIEFDEGEEMDIQIVSYGTDCMYNAILSAAKDKDLLDKATTVEVIKEGINEASKRAMAKAAISKLRLPACICIEDGNGNAVVDYNKNIVDESDTIFILERLGGFHYDWLKRRGAAAGGSAGGASLALRF